MTEEIVKKMAEAASNMMYSHIGGHKLRNTDGDILWETRGTLNLTLVAEAMLGAVREHCVDTAENFERSRRTEQEQQWGGTGHERR